MQATRKILLLLLTLIPGAFSGGSFANNYDPDYCNVYGIFYVVDDPKEADYRIYEEETEGSADLWVYATDDKLFADRPGLWYFTDKKGFADFYVYIEKSKHLADFSVFYIDVESFAGCND